MKSKVGVAIAPLRSGLRWLGQIQPLAMSLPRWDRIYFFAFLATVFAALGYLVLLFVPLVEVEYVTNVDGLLMEEVTRRTLPADGEVLPLLVSLLPVVLTGGMLLVIPRDGAPDRSGKIILWLSTFLIYVFVVILILSIGMLFVPAAILITAAAVGSQVRRRGARSQLAQESKSGRGGGKSWRNNG